MSELKECPFCGGDVEINTEEIFEEREDEDYYLTVVSCINKVTCTARVSSVMYEKDASRDDAIEKWNKRDN